MAPTHWSDLSEEEDEDGGDPTVVATPAALPFAGRQPGNPPQSSDEAQREALERAQQENPAFAKLMEQREALQSRMDRALSGGGERLDPRDAIRFAVPGMAQRRAEHDAWQARRDGRARERTRGNQAASSRPEPPLRRFGRALGPAGGISVPQMPGLALRPTPGESAGGSAMDPARWMEQRDASRTRRGPSSSVGDDYSRLDQRLDRARSQASQAQDPMADLDRQFDEADRKLADEGLESERAELKKMKDDMNIDAFSRPSSSTDSTFDKFRSTTDRRKDAGERIEQSWLARRDAIGGEDMDSYMKPLREVKERVLGMRAEDFDRRSDERRTAALEKRRERLRQEQAEEKRRERALKNRRERTNAD